MIESVSGMPPGTIGFRASGTVSADDYRDTLEPALAAAVERGEKINLLYEMASGVSYSPGAAAQDMKTGVALGLPHLGLWQRTALVSDEEWVNRLAHSLGWMMPGELRVFPTAELADAKAWLAG